MELTIPGKDCESALQAGERFTNGECDINRDSSSSTSINRRSSNGPAVATVIEAMMVSLLAVVTEVLMKVVIALVMAVMVIFTVARIILLVAGEKGGHSRRKKVF